MKSLDLDNYQKVKRLDKGRVLASIELLPNQCQQAFNEVSKIKIPSHYRKVKNIVTNGMGGSGFGSHIIQSFNKLKIPLLFINSYNLPSFVNQNTLYIISSYSGNTEEPVSTFKEARRRKAKIFAIGRGGKLAQEVKKYKIPAYIFEDKNNPSGEPRLGAGYSIIGQMGLLKKCGLLKLEKTEISKLIDYLEKLKKKFGLEVPTQNNIVKKITLSLKDTIPIVVASEFLAGNAHVLANQLNENAKNFATYFLIPELNHHLMEGLSYPKLNKKVLKFFFLNSNFCSRKIKIRFKVTQEVLVRNRIPFIEYRAGGQNKFLQSFEILLLGSYLGFYLAVLNKTNPAKIPWVDYFKRELARY